MKLYLIVLAIFLVIASRIPIYAAIVLGVVLLVVFVGNMRFVEKRDD